MYIYIYIYIYTYIYTGCPQRNNPICNDSSINMGMCLVCSTALNDAIILQILPGRVSGLRHAYIFQNLNKSIFSLPFFKGIKHLYTLFKGMKLQ